MFHSKRAQSAVEYIFIVSIALLLLVPGTVIFYRYSADSQASLTHAQVFKIGNDLVDSAELMYSMGVAWQTVDVSLPSAIEEIRVYNATPFSELVISYSFEQPSEAVFFTRRQLYNSSSLDCSDGCIIPIDSGINKIRVESNEDGHIIFRVR